MNQLNALRRPCLAVADLVWLSLLSTCPTSHCSQGLKVYLSNEHSVAGEGRVPKAQRLRV